MDFTLKQNTPLESFNKHWQFCVGSGHAALALRTDYVRLLSRVRHELDIKRVRFHGVFMDDMHTVHSMSDIFALPGSGRFREQSFHLCGIAYDNVLDCGMEPFVELSFMPKRLAKIPVKGAFYYKPIIAMPKSDAVWTEYIQDFVKFLIRRYGKARVESWFFEVWNEPDLRFIFFTGGLQKYLHLYEITARAIKSVDADIPVGGPSTSGSRWVEEFVSFCHKRNVPADFVSTHQYAGDPLGGVEDSDATKKGGFRIGKYLRPFAGLPDGTVLEAFRHFMGDKSETEDITDNVFATNSQKVKQQAGGLPVYYTEWNFNSTISAYTNDTRKVAAYDVKTALAVEKYVDGSSIWCFSDIFEEFHQFPEEFHGGFGLLTKSGIPKPVYHAMKLLGEVPKERYVLPGALDSEVSFAAFRGEDEIHCVLVRQKMKNLALPKERANVEIELERPPQSVTMKIIDEKRGNPLALWEDMGRPADLTCDEAADIEKRSALVVQEPECVYENSALKFSADLGVNDLCFVTIKL